MVAKLTLLLSAFVAVQLGSAAWAGDYNMTSSCEMRNGNLQCSSYDSFGSGGQGGRRLSKQETAEIEARSRRWEEYCQPKLHVGEYGVGRYSYAHPGCEYGRYE